MREGEREGGRVCVPAGHRAHDRTEELEVTRYPPAGHCRQELSVLACPLKHRVQEAEPMRDEEPAGQVEQPGTEMVAWIMR